MKLCLLVSHQLLIHQDLNLYPHIRLRHPCIHSYMEEAFQVYCV